jgi:hypothetical protein
MPDYNKTVIYKICCKDETITDMYIGHTTNFKKRFNCHKSRTNNLNYKGYNFKVYQYIRENGGWDNWNMLFFEKYSCDDVKQAEQRERHWIEELKSSLNIKIPSRSNTELSELYRKNAREYYKKNTNKVKEYQKEYEKKNADKIKEYKKEYFKEYCEQNADKLKEKAKIYKEQNADKIKQKNKFYREQNANKIKEKAKELITCQCGCELRKDTLKRHQKSQKHKDLLEQLIRNDAIYDSTVSN